MLTNLTKFIKSNVAPNIATNPVDVYGNFEITFKACEGSDGNGDFSNSVKIETYNPSLPFLGVDLHNFIKNINDVEMNVNATQITLPGVSYGINRLMPMNSGSSVTMIWLNTKIPYIESIIVPWMQDNTINNNFPIIKCDLEIKFPKLDESMKDMTYNYYGVRPVECSLHKMTNEPLTDFYRKVSFDFDYFYIKRDNSSSNLDATYQESSLIDAQMYDAGSGKAQKNAYDQQRDAEYELSQVAQMPD